MPWVRSATGCGSPASAPGPDLPSLRRICLAGALFVLAALAAPALRSRPPLLDLADHEAGLAGPWRVHAEIIREPEPTSGGSQFDLRLLRVCIAGVWQPSGGTVRVAVAVPVEPRLLPGTQIETFLRLRVPTPPWNPGQQQPSPSRSYDARARLKSYRQIHLRRPGSGLEAQPGKLRNAVRRAIEARFGDAAPLASALLLGERGRIPDRVTLAMGRTGLAHLLAISGLHLGLLVAATVTVSRCAGFSPRFSLVAGIVAALLLPVLVTPRAAIRRAATMTALGLGARAAGRRLAALDVVAVSLVIVLLVDPSSARDPGLWLSAAAVIGMVLLGLGAAAAGTPPILVLLLAPVAAQGAVAPVMAHLSAEVATGGALLNLLAVPLLGLLMPLLYTTLLLHAIGAGALSSVTAMLSAFMLDTLVGIAQWGAASRWCAVAVPSPSLATAALWWTGAVTVWLVPWHLAPARRLPCRICGTALVVLAALVACRPPPAPESPQLVAVDVGQGDALLLHGNHGAVLVDAGGYPGVDYDVGAHVVAPTLRRLGIHELVVLAGTHAHADHYGGLAAIARDFPANELWLAPTPANHPLQRAVLQAASGATALTPLGERRLAGCRWKPLPPPLQLLSSATARVSNEASLVIELHCGRRRVLLTGDAGLPAERHWTLGGVVGGVLKIGHHGSASATGADLLARMRPRHALISVGRGNAFSLPRDEILRRLRRLPAAVYRTDRDGAITVRLGRRIRVSGTRWRAGE